MPKAEEFVDVVRGLWRTVARMHFRANKKSGRYLELAN